MIGSYAYPVPDDMKEEIAKALYDHKGSLDPETENKIFDRFSDTFLHDEYKALCGLKKQYEELTQTLSGEADKSEAVILNELNDRFYAVSKDNPANCSYIESRSNTLANSYYDKSSGKLGLPHLSDPDRRNCGSF